MFSHPVFQVTGHACIERFLGFSGHDVDAPGKMRLGMKDSVDSRKEEPSVDHCDAQWIPAFAGMTKKDHSPRSHGFLPFSQNAPRYPCLRRNDAVDLCRNDVAGVVARECDMVLELSSSCYTRIFPKQTQFGFLRLYIWYRSFLVSWL